MVTCVVCRALESLAVLSSFLKRGLRCQASEVSETYTASAVPAFLGVRTQALAIMPVHHPLLALLGLGVSTVPP